MSPHITTDMKQLAQNRFFHRKATHKNSQRTTEATPYDSPRTASASPSWSAAAPRASAPLASPAGGSSAGSTSKSASAAPAARGTGCGSPSRCPAEPVLQEGGSFSNVFGHFFEDFLGGWFKCPHSDLSFLWVRKWPPGRNPRGSWNFLYLAVDQPWRGDSPRLNTW